MAAARVGSAGPVACTIDRCPVRSLLRIGIGIVVVPRCPSVAVVVVAIVLFVAGRVSRGRGAEGMSLGWTASRRNVVERHSLKTARHGAHDWRGETGICCCRRVIARGSAGTSAI